MKHCTYCYEAQKVIILDMISQTWNGAGSGTNTTTPSVWHHWVTICVPTSPIASGGLLYIDGIFVVPIKNN